MSLAVSIAPIAQFKQADKEGYAYYTQVFEHLNDFLQSNQLATYTEPEELPAIPKPAISGQPYTWLHYLRWAYIQIGENPNVILEPVAETDNPVALMGEEVIDYIDSHLINHSDTEGFYLPIDFAEPLYDEMITGSTLGSSYRLLQELQEIAPSLGIHLNEGELSEEEAQRVYQFAKSETGLYREFSSWLMLYENARNSIHYKTAMMFQ